MGSNSQKLLIALYLEKRSNLLRFLIAQFRDEVIAEDIVQEVYLKLQKMTGNQTLSNPEAYLIRITNNVALDYRRQLARRKARDHAWSEVSVQSVGGEPVYDAPDAENIVDSKKRTDELLALINLLPPKSREAFIAHKIDGLTYSEVAAKMNISKSAVEKHMSRALKFIALHIKDGH
ncbi:RNA polymerase sigma factor [Kordiimonas laminariae]|uniref:RNA polymerase sigma factor n=1 Tax=Kordiimonas laminariae TaxID=2917717 RepID=UPI001FF1E8C2|nr:RNA polymerase sigma factor [Kordiimonas laminariae]MCK0070739.1 RNA polymerase sigma factor [Kordiimonas laminariae]